MLRKNSIVGIGASAGGLNHLNCFLKILPIDTWMAFVIIQHLDPTHEGILPELIQRKNGNDGFIIKNRLKWNLITYNTTKTKVLQY
jgi:two-component system CheB/CheR fusion protein